MNSTTATVYPPAGQSVLTALTPVVGQSGMPPVTPTVIVPTITNVGPSVMQSTLPAAPATVLQHPLTFNPQIVQPQISAPVFQHQLTANPQIVQPQISGTIPRSIKTITISQQLWRKKFPSVVTSILSIIECIATLAIIGCEVGSILIDAVTGTIYVGFWAGIFLMIAWIMEASSACCCRGPKYASITLVAQFIAMLFAACVIGFDSYYIINPKTCFFPNATCYSDSRGLYYSKDNFNNIKIPLIKGQLAGGALMFTLCFIYIIIYLVVKFAVYYGKKRVVISTQQPYTMGKLPAEADAAATMTAAPSMMTAGPSMMTAAPSMMTTGPSMMTAGPPTMTAAPLTMTPGPSMMTAAAPMMTAAPPMMTPAPPGLNVRANRIDSPLYHRPGLTMHGSTGH